MSTEPDEKPLDAAGVPELTPLGKQIEVLRLDRRMSKGVLAQRAGTSRQQLWRVMTGKSDLTSSLCARLAEVLEVDSRLLRDSNTFNAEKRGLTLDRHGTRAIRVSAAARFGAADGARDGAGFAGSLESYLADPHGLERTFETLPMTHDGRRLKRALLNAVEDIAEARSLKLPPAFFDLRRRVVNGEN